MWPHSSARNRLRSEPVSRCECVGEREPHIECSRFRDLRDADGKSAFRLEVWILPFVSLPSRAIANVEMSHEWAGRQRYGIEDQGDFILLRPKTAARWSGPLLRRDRNERSIQQYFTVTRTWIGEYTRLTPDITSNSTKKRRPQQLNHIEISPFGVHWPDLDEDLSFDGLLNGNHGQFQKGVGV